MTGAEVLELAKKERKEEQIKEQIKEMKKILAHIDGAEASLRLYKAKLAEITAMTPEENWE